MQSQEEQNIQKAIVEIENAFDRKGRYLQNGIPRYTAHAVRLEEQTGIRGIAGRYHFLQDKDPSFIEYEYRKRFLKYSLASSLLSSDDPAKRQAAETITRGTPEALKEVNHEISLLETLNPELKQLNYDKRDFIESYRALIGITSQYNPDDINAYLHSVRTGKKDVKMNDRIEQLNKKGCRFGWVPSASTLTKIENFYAVKEKTLFLSAAQNSK